MHKYEVLEKCNENLLKANEILNNENIDAIIKIMTNPLINRISTIKEICSVEKYNLCFIGSVGVGKSTAITNLLGLIDQEQLLEGHKLMDIPLLKTGEGRTTLCETVISFVEDKPSSIDIDALSYDDFKELVDNFCLISIKSIDTSSDEKIKCSNEIQRAIRNMSEFPRNNDEKQLEYVQKELGSEYNNEKDFLTQVKNAILKKIDYHNRVQTHYTYDNKESIEKWIKTISAKLNDGEISSAPYPAKLYLTLNKNDFKVSIPSFINRVHDTRGIDGEAVREDIINFCKDINNFCIICDDIKNYGNIISESFLRNQFIPKNKDLKYRNFVMGIEQNAQLKKVNEATGRESGKDLKKDEAENMWKNKVCLDRDNMFFYNSFYGIKYDSDEQEIISVEKDAYENEKEAVVRNLENQLYKMYENYSNELADINHQLSIFGKNNIEETHKIKLAEIRTSITECLIKLQSNHNIFNERLENEVRHSIHAGTIRASVNQHGKYYNYNIYDQAKDVSYEEFDKTCKEPLFYIDKEFSRIFDDSNMMEDALHKAIKYKTDELFTKYREKNASDYHDILEENIYNEQCWNIMAQFWGNKIPGIKYRDRVADLLFRTIKDNNVLPKIIQNKNTNKFFEDLSLFIDIS